MPAIKRKRYAIVARISWLVLVSLAFPARAGLAQEGPTRKADAREQKAPRDKAAQADMEWLQGTWTCTYMEADGKEIPLKDYPALRGGAMGTAVFQGNYWMETGEDGKTLKRFLAVKLVPGGEPKQIDLVRGDREEVLAGIYKFDGETLTLCLTIDKYTPMRPTHFVTKKDLPLMLFVYERKKAGTKAASPRLGEK